MTRTQALTAERRRGAPKTGAPSSASREVIPEGLDWGEFSAAYFPGRRRHDLEALVAYGAYRRRRIVDESSGDAGRLAEAESAAGGAPALQVWEDERGAVR